MKRDNFPLPFKLNQFAESDQWMLNTALADGYEYAMVRMESTGPSLVAIAASGKYFHQDPECIIVSVADIEGL
jgi:hypothetical protein